MENDYILSANTYNPHSGEEEVNHRDPKEILEDVANKENALSKLLEEIRRKI